MAVIGYLPISQDFPCSGIPQWAVAKKGIVALDISTGNKYIQGTFPYGNNWKLLSIKNIYDPGGVQSVTGLNTNNTDPQNPVINIAVDGVTITGLGTLASPLVASSSGYSYGYVQVNTTPYSVVVVSGVNVYFVDATSGPIVINMPTAVGNNAMYVIKKTDSSSNTVTIQPNGVETIDGQSSAVIRFQNTSIDIYSDGVNLYIA